MNLLPPGLASLPNELILEIFNHIKKITDKRQFLKTCKTYNKITRQSMLNYENNYYIPNFNYKNKYSMEKFTLELCHDGYFNLIPEYYIQKSNDILALCGAYYNNVKILELCKFKGCNLNKISEYGAISGHISVLDFCIKNNCNRDLMLYYLIRNGHVHALKWLKTNDQRITSKSCSLCSMAVQSDHLEVLKFLREINCPWDQITYKFALKLGNNEMIKWMVDNGCPTN